jgi:hypothetical protein
MNSSTVPAYMYQVTVNSSGLFVAVGVDSINAPVYATSANGSTWTTPARMNGSSVTAQMSGIAVNSSGLFVAVGADSINAPVYATSTNGSNWTTPARMNGSSVAAPMLFIAVSSSGLFVAIGSSGTNAPTFATSTDGSTWTTPTSMSGHTGADRILGLAVNSSGLFVGVGNNINSPFAGLYVTSFVAAVGSTTWTDSTGNNSATTLYATPTYNSLNGGSLLFNGSTQYCQNDSPTLPAGTGNRTIIAWIKPDSTRTAETYTGVVAYGNRGGTNPSTAVLLSIYTNGTTMYVSSAYWSNDYVPNVSAVQLVPNAWNMIGIVARGAATTNNTTLFVGNSNGLTYNTGSSNNYTYGLNIPSTTLTVGCTDQGGGRSFKGNIATVQVYSRELSTTEIAQNFNATKTRYGL